MVDITITGVKQITKLQPGSLLLGETCAAYDVVQIVGSKYMLATALDAAKDKPSHILIEGGADTEYVSAYPLQSGYSMTIEGPTLILGAQYVLSAANAGKIAPRADLTTGQLLTDIFKGAAANIGDIQVESSGIGVA